MKKMQLKERFEIVGIILLVFVCLYVIGHDPYLIAWLANNYFLFIWLPICLLLLFNLPRCAWCIAGGSFLGIPIGQGVEYLKVSLFGSDTGSSYWGIPAWVAVVVLSVVLGVFLEIRQRKKTPAKK